MAVLPNQVAASEALRLNWDSKNLGPNVDMPAIRVASVAPARHRKINVGFFNRSNTDLERGNWDYKKILWLLVYCNVNCVVSHIKYQSKMHYIMQIKVKSFSI